MPREGGATDGPAEASDDSLLRFDHFGTLPGGGATVALDHDLVLTAGIDAKPPRAFARSRRQAARRPNGSLRDAPGDRDAGGPGGV